MSQWRASLHTFQGNNQRLVLHSCHVIQLIVLAIAFVCAWWLHAEFVSFDYAVRDPPQHIYLFASILAHHHRKLPRKANGAKCDARD